MSNYTKAVDFAAKDALLAGNPAKLGKGTEVDTEFNNIATAIASKIDLNGAGGTPSSLTLTNATGLPAAALVASTSQAVGFGSIKLGHASDTTLTRVSAGTLAVDGVNALTTTTGVTSTAAAASSGSSIVGHISSGTGAVATTVQTKLRESVSVEDFGAVGDGVTDDVTKIQAALDAVSAIGGGEVNLFAKTYAISASLSIPSGVKLIGRGSGQYPSAAYVSSSNFKATKKTRLVALTGFPALTAMIKVCTGNSALYTHHACGLEGIMVDCDAKAAYGIDVVSVKNSTFRNLLVYQPLTRGILEDCLVSTHEGTAQAGGANTITLQTSASTRDSHYNALTITITGGTGSGQVRTISSYVGSTQIATVSSNWATQPNATSTYSILGLAATEGNSATQFNLWENITVWANSAACAAAIGWVQDGTTANNVNQNTYVNIKTSTRDGDGVLIHNADSNIWVSLQTHNIVGTGVGLRLKGNEKNVTDYARNTLFTYLQCATISGTGGLVAEGGASRGSRDNVVTCYAMANGAPVPSVDVAGGARISYSIDTAATQGWVPFTPTVTFSTPGDMSVSYTVQVGRYWKQGPSVQIYVALTFIPTHTTASGSFSVTGLPFTADSGTLGFPIAVQSGAGMTWPASCTQISAQVGNGLNDIILSGMGSNISRVNFTEANFATGTTKSIVLCGTYESSF